MSENLQYSLAAYDDLEKRSLALEISETNVFSGFKEVIRAARRFLKIL